MRLPSPIFRFLPAIAWRLSREIATDNTASESTINIESALPGKRTDPMMSKSPNTTGKKPVATKLPPVHPGEILKETLDDLGISMNRLAQALHVPSNRVSSIIAGHRGITGETALRLARYFNTTPDYWINMQAQYDLEVARDEWDARIQSEVHPRHAA